MAATNLVFKMPLEPHPLPSLEDDEESFVVLGQSMPDSNVDEYMSTPVDISVIAEAKRLIDSELDALNSMNNKPDEKKETTGMFCCQIIISFLIFFNTSFRWTKIVSILKDRGTLPL